MLLRRNFLMLILMALVISYTIGSLPKTFSLDETAGNIYIRADGSVYPDSTPIDYVRGVYIFTANISNQSIWVERSNITIDGGGYTLKGPGTGIGFNLTGVENVVVKDTNIEGFQYGVYVSKTSNSSIINSNVTDNFLGIKIHNSNYCKVGDSNVKDNSNRGIHITYSHNSVIEGNNVSINGRQGVDIEYSTNNTVLGNEAIYNIYGISLFIAHRGLISDNEVVGNKYGILITNSSYCHVSGNSVTDNEYNIRLDFSPQNTLRNNSMFGQNYNFGIFGSSLGQYIQDVDTSNTVNGKAVYYLINQSDLIVDPSTHPNIGYLAVINSTDVTAKDFHVPKNRQGILFAYTTNSRIINVTVAGNKYGMALYRCNDLVVSNSEVTYNMYHGIMLQYSSNCHIVSNEFTGNTDAIYLTNSHDCTLSGNRALENVNGIRLGNSPNNSISENYIAESSDFGVMLEKSSSNIFSHNYFVDNKIQVFDLLLGSPEKSDISINTWDDGSKGNYWSDYTDWDEDGDYIGDIPYIINPDNSDRFPLMRAKITIIHPEKRIYTVKDIPLTFFVSESPFWIGYCLDGQENVTISGNTTILGLADGDHNLTVYMNNTAGHAVRSISAYFSLDTVSPVIEILSPENKVYEAKSVPFSFVVSESTSWISYSLAGQENVTITENSTISKLEDGIYSLTVYAEDIAGNVGSSETILFTIHTKQVIRLSESNLALIALIAIVGAVILWRRTFFMKRVGLLNLSSLLLAASGTCILVWVGWLTWYDITVWGKDLGLIFLGSRVGENISLGIGMTVMYYFLIGLGLLLSGLIISLQKRINGRVTRLLEILRARLVQED